MKILRDEPSGICMGLGGSFVSASSQVSILSPATGKHVHFFTGTPDPSVSLFKPFIFDFPVSNSEAVLSPKFSPSEDPAIKKPRFQSQVDRRHKLYKANHSAVATAKPADLEKIKKKFHEQENQWIKVAENDCKNSKISKFLLAIFFLV